MNILRPESSELKLLNLWNYCHICLLPILPKISLPYIWKKKKKKNSYLLKNTILRQNYIIILSLSNTHSLSFIIILRILSAPDLIYVTIIAIKLKISSISSFYKRMNRSPLNVPTISTSTPC